MGPKKDNDSSKMKRKNTNIMIDVEKEIIANHENGVRVSDLATQFGMAKSTMCTILKTELIKFSSIFDLLSVVFIFFVTDLMVSIDFVLKTCAQITVVKV